MTRRQTLRDTVGFESIGLSNVGQAAIDYVVQSYLDCSNQPPELSAPIIVQVTVEDAVADAIVTAYGDDVLEDVTL